MNDPTLLKNLELEFRLGKITEYAFDTNIGQLNFNKIKNTLYSFNWYKTETNTFTDILYNDNIRQCLETNACIKKINFDKQDIHNNSMDIRMSISQEIPVLIPSSLECLRRYKKRYSFFNFKLWRIDLTEVITDDQNCYQCELEYTDINYIRTHDIDFLKTLAIKELNNILICSNI